MVYFLIHWSVSYLNFQGFPACIFIIIKLLDIDHTEQSICTIGGYCRRRSGCKLQLSDRLIPVYPPKHSFCGSIKMRRFIFYIHCYTFCEKFCNQRGRQKRHINIYNLCSESQHPYCQQICLTNPQFLIILSGANYIMWNNTRKLSFYHITALVSNVI